MQLSSSSVRVTRGRGWREGGEVQIQVPFSRGQGSLKSVSVRAGYLLMQKGTRKSWKHPNVIQNIGVSSLPCMGTGLR